MKPYEHRDSGIVFLITNRIQNWYETYPIDIEGHLNVSTINDDFLKEECRQLMPHSKLGKAIIDEYLEDESTNQVLY